MRWLLPLVLFGCGDGGANHLPPTTKLLINSDSVRFEGTDEIPATIAVSAEPTKLSNVAFEHSRMSYYGIIDGVPTYITSTMQYDLSGDSEHLEGTAQYRMANAAPWCDHTIESVP